MKLSIYSRSDRRLVVVPASVPAPSGLPGEGPLRIVGTAYIAMADLSQPLGRAIAVHGFGTADEMDTALIYESILHRTF